MSVKAVGLVDTIVNSSLTPPNTPGTYDVGIAYVGLDPSNPVTDSTAIYNVVASTTKLALKALLKAAVQSDLSARFGYTFGMSDTVKLLNV